MYIIRCEFLRTATAVICERRRRKINDADEKKNRFRENVTGAHTPLLLLLLLSFVISFACPARDVLSRRRADDGDAKSHLQGKDTFGQRIASLRETISSEKRFRARL